MKIWCVEHGYSKMDWQEFFVNYDDALRFINELIKKEGQNKFLPKISINGQPNKNVTYLSNREDSVENYSLFIIDLHESFDDYKEYFNTKCNN